MCLAVVTLLHITLSVLGHESPQKIRDAPFDFTYNFKCPDTVFVNEVVQCNLTVPEGNRVSATVQWQGRPPLSHQFTEVNLLPLGVASLKRYEGSYINCSLPKTLIYGPITFEYGQLRSIAVSTDGSFIRFVVWFTPYRKSRIQSHKLQNPCNLLKGDEIRVEYGNKMKCVRVGKLHPQAPIDSVPAKLDSLYAKVSVIAEGRAFEVMELDGDICMPAAQLKLDTAYEVALYANTSTRTGRDTHRIRLGRRFGAALSVKVTRPQFTAETLIIRVPEHVVLKGTVRGGNDFRAVGFCWQCEVQCSNGSTWNISEGMMRLLEGSKTNTLVISPEFIRQLPDQGQLHVCTSLAHPQLENLKSCLTLDVWSPTTCDQCSLDAPPIIHDFQRVCVVCDCPPIQGKFEFYAVEGGIQMCIRSLPSSSLYIDKCFHDITFVRSTPEEFEKQMTDILSGSNDILDESIASKDPNTISATVQAMCAQIREFVNSSLTQSSPTTAGGKRDMIAQLTGKLVEALEEVRLVDYEHLLPLSSGLEAVATVSSEITFTTMNRMQKKLVEVEYVLPQLLSHSSFQNVFNLVRRFTNIGVYLLEGMRYQYEKPSPSLNRTQPQELDYETDIDADPVESFNALILKHIREFQRLTSVIRAPIGTTCERCQYQKARHASLVCQAKSVTEVLKNINSVLAGSLHEVLVPGGPMFQANFSTGDSVRFCRAMTCDLVNDREACGESNIIIPNLTDLQNLEDIVIRTSRFADNIYPFFNRGQHNPRSSLVSLTFYAEGRALNISGNQLPFRFTLTRNTATIGAAKRDLEFGEQEVQLPEPIVAVDGTLVHQLLIMHRFKIDQEKTTFVFQLHPTETTTCPQYLLIARFSIPPNLQVLDDYGSFYWAMLPSSTSACENLSDVREWRQIYSLYIYPDVLGRLKAEADARTRHLKIRAEELNLLYIGYRQLSANELNHYDEMNPPPVPYPFRDQINATAYVSAIMPSCVHITPGEDAWRSSGCKAVPSLNPDEILCQCTHLTTFAADFMPMRQSAHFKYILQRDYSTRVSTPAYLVTVAIALSTLLVTRESHEIAAHRLVLCTRFPLIGDQILSHEGKRIEWKRFSTNIVQAAMDYAYTGNATLNSDNVTGLFLLAHNLRCSLLITWCVDYMRGRITLENLEEIWFIANATANRDLIDECIPLMAVIFEGLSDSRRFFRCTEVEGFTALLNVLRLSGVAEETKLRAIAIWLDSPSHLSDRLNLDKLPATLIAGITSGESDIAFSKECRKILLNTWRDARRVNDNPPRHSGSVAKCNSTKVMESIFLHAWDEESAYGVLTSLPQAKDAGNLRYCAPYRRNCSVATLNDDVYIIGGKDDNGKSLSQVERVNLYNGQIHSTTPMSRPRSGASAVASDRSILVFGGYDKTRNVMLSSCEEYDPVADRQVECQRLQLPHELVVHEFGIVCRWTALPNMPTARYATGAVYIPDVSEVVVGGYDGIGKSASDLNTAELLLDSKEGTEGERIWCAITPMLQPRSWPTGVYSDGRVFVARVGDDSVEALTLSSGHWTLICRSFVVDSYPFSMAAFGERLLLAADNGSIYELKKSTGKKEPQAPEFTWDLICRLHNVSHVTLIARRLNKGAA
ncbi:Kelch-like protein 8 [Taenia crassiceps]|uniref:Kelch-like protein 8 n=1 Tax=Taenia crassiceps TaxID=6207 RepID=A0ABR4QB00_9CEST